MIKKIENIKDFKKWYPEYSDISDSFIFEHLKHCTNESFGIFQILNGKLCKIFKDFIATIKNDIMNEKFQYIENNSFYHNYVYDSDKLYKLSYKFPFNWLLRLNVVIIESKLNYDNGGVDFDDENLVILGKDKILHATVFLVNPKNNENLEDTIFHEIKHLYTNYKIVSSNSKYRNNNDDLKISYKLQTQLKIDYENTAAIIKSLNNKEIGNLTFQTILSDCFYYLNKNEILSRQENLFCELEKVKDKNLSNEEMLKLSKTYSIYKGIENIILYLLKNKLDFEKTIIADEIRYNMILKACGKQNNKNKYQNLHFLYNLFLSKLQLLFKHTNKMCEYLKKI